MKKHVGNATEQKTYNRELCEFPPAQSKFQPTNIDHHNPWEHAKDINHFTIIPAEWQRVSSSLHTNLPVGNQLNSAIAIFSPMSINARGPQWRQLALSQFGLDCPRTSNHEQCELAEMQSKTT